MTQNSALVRIARSHRCLAKQTRPQEARLVQSSLLGRGDNSDVRTASSRPTDLGLNPAPHSMHFELQTVVLTNTQWHFNLSWVNSCSAKASTQNIPLIKLCQFQSQLLWSDNNNCVACLDHLFIDCYNDQRWTEHQNIVLK